MLEHLIWMGKRGLLARFYSCNGIFFIDYKNCTETARLSKVNTKERKVELVAPGFDIPKKYLDGANKYAVKHNLI